MSLYPQIKTLGDICSYHSAERGSQVALLFRERVTTYAALEQYANQVARALLGRDGSPD